MTVINKLAMWVFKAKKPYNKTQKLILKTYNFSRKNNIKIIYKNLDFLTVKLNRDINILKEIENTLTQIYIWDDIYLNTDINLIYNKKIIFDRFFIIYAWNVYWWQKQLYNIYDFEKNKVWQVVLKNLSSRKNNKNIINSLELSWLFFKCYYKKYFDDFLKLFEINKNQQNIVKRLDYCVDFKWIEVFEYLPFLKDINKISKVRKWFTWLDYKQVMDLKEVDFYKKLKNGSIEIKHWNQQTYIRYSNVRNDLKIYDKVLRVLDEIVKKKVKVYWENPYKDYFHSDLPITRFEIKKKNFIWLWDNSLNFYLDNIESLFFDYLLNYFEINLSYYVWENISLNWKKLYLAKEEKQKNIYHSFMMARAYLSNIKEYTWDKTLYKFLFKEYPELEKIKPLELIDPIEFSDYFNWISDELIDVPF